MQHKAAFYSVIVLITLIFSVRLFNIQIMNDEYAARAERNATQAEKLYAPRGYIYDRNGQLMVGNSPTYDLMVSPYLVKDLDTVQLGKLLDLEVADIKKRLEKAKKYSYFRSSMFMKMLPKEHYARINTELKKFAGFYPKSVSLEITQGLVLPMLWGSLEKSTPTLFAKTKGIPWGSLWEKRDR